MLSRKAINETSDDPLNDTFEKNRNIDDLVQERCNSIAKALELRLSSTNPSIYMHHQASMSLWTHRSLKRVEHLYDMHIKLQDD